MHAEVRNFKFFAKNSNSRNKNLGTNKSPYYSFSVNALARGIENLVRQST